MKTKIQESSDQHARQVKKALYDIYGDCVIQPGSGNQVDKPGDVRVPKKLLIECKTTAAESMIVKWRWLDKLQREAFVEHLCPLLSIRFCNDEYRIFYVIEDVDLYDLLRGKERG